MVHGRMADGTEPESQRWCMADRIMEKYAAGVNAKCKKNAAAPQTPDAPLS